jgi:UDP-glucose 4-epimerase
MRILIIGGAGFIGKHLTRFLLKKEHSITIFDNFSNSTKESINSLIDMGVKVIEGDIIIPNEISNATKEQDMVIHLAAKISVSESIINPSKIFQVNVNGTRNVLAACERNNIKKIIAASSAAVYGEGSPDVKLTEKSETNPISPYGESKLKMEQEIIKFALKYNINYVILRFFNIYGAGQSKEYAGVISKFIERVRQDKPLEIFGNGLQTRDFVAIKDVINSIHNAISHDKSGTYNIASGKVVTIKELAELVLSISGKELEIKYTTPKNEDIIHSQSNIDLAKINLKYHPKFELREGIKEL